MITSTLIRLLEVDPASHPRGQSHISSASGLVVIGDWFYLVADDENHLVALRSSDVESGPIQMVPLSESPLPTDPAERKRQKKDLETLFLLPGNGHRPSMLVAWGSGSRASRDVAYLIPLSDGGGLAGPARAVCLSRLHDLLRTRVPALNIEAALVQDTELSLFSRAHAGAPVNAWFRFDLATAIEFLLAAPGAAPVPPMQMAEMDLGRIHDVPIGITDAALLDDGGWLLSAVAENTSNAFDDGRCEGAMLVACDPQGNVVWSEILDDGPKVEGIAFDTTGALWMVTDADAPDVPSQLRRVRWPPPGFRRTT